MDVHKNTFDDFKQSDFLRGVDKEHYADILDCGSLRTLKSGEPLFHEGASARSCYLVLKGRLKLVKLHERGKETVIRYVGPGELTAVMAIFREKEFPVTARAIGDTEVVRWNKSAITRLMSKYPPLTVNVLRAAFDRLEDMQRRYVELSTERVEQRVARSLLRIMKHSGRRTDAGVVIDFPLTRQELAEYAGTTLYTVSRVLTAWEKKGWIKSRREQITISDPHSLVLFADNR